MSPWPAMKSRPKIVENQCGSSDITQSIAVNVTVKPQNSRPGPRQRSACACATRVAVAVLPPDQRLKNHDRSIQPPK